MFTNKNSYAVIADRHLNFMYKLYFYQLPLSAYLIKIQFASNKGQSQHCGPEIGADKHIDMQIMKGAKGRYLSPDRCLPFLLFWWDYNN